MTDGPTIDKPATISLTVYLELLGALKLCADELQAEIDARYMGMLHYPLNQRRYTRDMEAVREARAAIARAERELQP